MIIASWKTLLLILNLSVFPLKIQVADQVFVDDANLDIDKMMETMYATSEASKSACPSPDDYLRAFEGAKHIFVVTITGTLSGSHNSAQLAKNIYLEEHLILKFMSSIAYQLVGKLT